jgi:hypothetical protein
MNDNVSASNGQAASTNALTFLRWLYGDDPPGWLTIWTLPDKATGWYPAHKLKQAATYALNRADTHNVYFGLGLRQEQIEDGRGESDDVLGIPGLWIEVDIKHFVHTKVNLPESIEEALALVLEALPLQPSLIILSGYGIHIYWLFRELWIFEDADDRQEAYHLLHRLQATIQAVAKLHGWEVDSTFDLARVLRIPGTYNRNVSDDPKLVEIIEAHPDRRYNPSDFHEHLIEVDETTYQQMTGEEYAGDLPLIELHTLNIPTWLKTLVRYGEDINAEKPYPSRSEALFDAAQGLIKAGIEDHISMSLLLDSRYAVSEKPREKGRKWLAGELARARAKLNGHRPTATSTPEPKASEAEPEGHHSSEHGDDQHHDGDEHHEDDNYKPIPPYLIKWSAKKGNALYYQKPGTTDEQILANFMAWIVEERLEDDGAEPVRKVALDATLISGKRFPEIRIAVPEFYSLAGILKALGTEAVVSPGPMVKDRIRHAIQLFSNRKKYPQRHVFTHLGWRKVGESWRYLHAGGSIPAIAEVSVDKALQRYTLPQVSSPQSAIHASLRTLEVAPRRLTIPLLSLVYLAPLAHWLETDVTGWLEGPSGARKSSLAALMMCHFGTFSRVHPPDSWESTANTLERLAFLAKDTLLWIDDYAPQPSAKEAHEQERKAQRVIRAQGNLSGRGRMRADTSLRPQYYPRGVILSTGELHPTGTSTFARILQLDVDKNDVNLDVLSTSQTESHLLAEVMAAYVGWIQPQLETLPAMLKARWHELRSQGLPYLTHHSRHPEVYAHLAVAWELFLRFATENGVLTENDRLLQWHAGCETLMQAINRQRIDAEAEDPVHRFCSHIKEALIQGKGYLDDVRGGYPEDAGQWGWTMQTIRHNDGTMSDEWKPSQAASMLGWIDKDFVYLLPDAAYRLVFENLQRAGVTLLPQQTLWKRLIDRGYVQRGEKRYTTQKRIGDVRIYILKLVRRHVEGYLSPQSDDSDDNEGRKP